MVNSANGWVGSLTVATVVPAYSGPNLASTAEPVIGERRPAINLMQIPRGR
jgi:hypothetical protein